MSQNFGSNNFGNNSSFGNSFQNNSFSSLQNNNSTNNQTGLAFYTTQIPTNIHTINTQFIEQAEKTNDPKSNI